MGDFKPPMGGMGGPRGGPRGGMMNRGGPMMGRGGPRRFDDEGPGPKRGRRF